MPGVGLRNGRIVADQAVIEFADNNLWSVREIT